VASNWLTIACALVLHACARFATEQAVSVNSAAVGGNATLLSLDEED
jgi:delta 1-pyrroline-5-carboxylate dehydrogenase